jgi:hypothetical protein
MTTGHHYRSLGRYRVPESRRALSSEDALEPEHQLVPTLGVSAAPFGQSLLIADHCSWDACAACNLGISLPSVLAFPGTIWLRVCLVAQAFQARNTM